MGRTLATTAGFLLAALLNGCSVSPSLPPEESVREALPDTTEIPESWAGDHYDPGQVDDDWIRAFNDPVLEALVDEAVRNNLNLVAVAAQMDIAAASVVQAGAALKPSIGLGAAATTTGSSSLDDNLQSSNVMLAASWELDVWGRIRAGREAADAAYRATEADFRAAGQSLAAATAKAWFLASQIQQQKALAEESIEIFRQTESLVQRRTDVGRAQPQDLPLAKANVAAAEANLNQVEISRRAILRGLELLLGRYPRGELETAKTFVALPPPIPVGLPSELLERRPDIVAAERRLAAAFYGVQVAEAARLPRISLTAAGGGVDSGLADLVGITSPVAQLGANMFAPLYNGGALQAGVDIADAQQRATMALYAQKALEAFSEVEGALTNEPLLKNREERLQSALEQSEEAYARTKRQYEVGRVELLALLQTQASLISAKSALIAVKNERLAQRVDLHLALGGSFQ